MLLITDGLERDPDDATLKQRIAALVVRGLMRLVRGPVVIVVMEPFRENSPRERQQEAMRIVRGGLN